MSKLSQDRRLSQEPKHEVVRRRLSGQARMPDPHHNIPGCPALPLEEPGLEGGEPEADEDVDEGDGDAEEPELHIRMLSGRQRRRTRGVEAVGGAHGVTRGDGQEAEGPRQLLGHAPAMRPLMQHAEQVTDDFGSEDARYQREHRVYMISVGLVHQLEPKGATARMSHNSHMK